MNHLTKVRIGVNWTAGVVARPGHPAWSVDAEREQESAEAADTPDFRIRTASFSPRGAPPTAPRPEGGAVRFWQVSGSLRLLLTLAVVGEEPDQVSGPKASIETPDAPQPILFACEIEQA